MDAKLCFVTKISIRTPPDIPHQGSVEVVPLFEGGDGPTGVTRVAPPTGGPSSLFVYPYFSDPVIDNGEEFCCLIHVHYMVG